MQLYYKYWEEFGLIPGVPFNRFRSQFYLCNKKPENKIYVARYHDCQIKRKCMVIISQIQLEKLPS